MKAILAVVLLLGITACVHADSNQAQQNLGVKIVEIAKIDWKGDLDDLVISSPGEAGAEPTSAVGTVGRSRLVYTSIVPADILGELKTRLITGKITASVFPGSGLPAGTRLRVVAADPGTPGKGGKGVGTGPTGVLITNADDRVVLQNIKSCYTTENSGSGSALTYSLEVANWSQLHSAEAGEITVTYTIQDAM